MTKKELKDLKNMLWIGARRFAKGFAAGGLAQVGLVLSSGFSITELADLQVLLGVLVTAFATGGLLALQKMLSYTPER